jgi:hypothetical protein
MYRKISRHCQAGSSRGVMIGGLIGHYHYSTEVLDKGVRNMATVCVESANQNDKSALFLHKSC